MNQQKKSSSFPQTNQQKPWEPATFIFPWFWGPRGGHPPPLPYLFDTGPEVKAVVSKVAVCASRVSVAQIARCKVVAMAMGAARWFDG